MGARPQAALPLAQPRSRSAVVRVDEHDAGLFERVLNRFGGAPLFQTISTARVARFYGWVLVRWRPWPQTRRGLPWR
jgi:hypothetical protein